MIDKEKISNLINDKKFKEVINEFSAVFLEKLKTILDFYKIDYNDDITLIECISIIEFKVPNSEIIVHVPMEIIFNESREIESRANFALNRYEKWLENVNSLMN
ncbi:MAG: hypothetical protein IKJ36_00080 [Clostridia bacterium]|nr:hypothetical protein [Clostridia bacterium]